MRKKYSTKQIPKFNGRSNKVILPKWGTTIYHLPLYLEDIVPTNELSLTTKEEMRVNVWKWEWMFESVNRIDFINQFCENELCLNLFFNMILEFILVKFIEPQFLLLD